MNAGTTRIVGDTTKGSPSKRATTPTQDPTHKAIERRELGLPLRVERLPSATWFSCASTDPPIPITSSCRAIPGTATVNTSPVCAPPVPRDQATALPHLRPPPLPRPARLALREPAPRPSRRPYSTPWGGDVQGASRDSAGDSRARPDAGPDVGSTPLPRSRLAGRGAVHPCGRCGADAAYARGGTPGIPRDRSGQRTKTKGAVPEATRPGPRRSTGAPRGRGCGSPSRSGCATPCDRPHNSSNRAGGAESTLRGARGCSRLRPVACSAVLLRGMPWRRPKTKCCMPS
jgi:hypothetical protein